MINKAFGLSLKMISSINYPESKLRTFFRFFKISTSSSKKVTPIGRSLP